MSLQYVNPLRELQIELSTSCNALCLGCVRTDQINFSKSKTCIPKGKFIDVEMLFTRILECETLTKLEFCGNIDEPLVHPDFLGLLQKLAHDRPELNISIHTNGSARNPKYFAQLAKCLKQFSTHNIRFSIDGLENTNAIYRQQTSFTKIIENANSFIASGGVADWQYIQFPWNIDDVKPAQKMAEKMGFRDFILRKDRSIDKETLLKIEDAKKSEIRFSTQKHKGFNPEEYQLQKNTGIDCYFRKYAMMFVSWDGKLWPCCFTANIFFESNLDKIKSFEENFYGDSTKNFNNLYDFSLEEIIANPVYQKNLVLGWENGEKKTPTAWRCVEKCSKSLPKKEALSHVNLN